MPSSIISSTVRVFFADFAIFTPSARRCCPCTQWRTTGWPSAPSDCAISSSWCGKMLSTPPVCRSKRSPRYFVLTNRPLVAPRDLLRRLPFGERRGDHLVFPAVDRVLAHVADVGDVLHRGDLVAEAGERAAEPVSEEVRAKVP